MKKSSIFILVLSVLVVMFLSAFVGLSVGCDYAKNHYTTNRRITSFSMEYTEYEYGCSEADCKYCNGTKATGESLKKSDYKEVFVYYKTINGFRIASLVCMIVSAVGLTSTLLIKYREPIKRLFKKK